MYVNDNERRARARQEINRQAISKYEHLEELETVHGQAMIPPMSLVGTVKPAEEQAREPRLRIWRTRRRRDGKIFLAEEINDIKRVLDDSKDTLLQLLDHPNLISLVDIVRDTDISRDSADYMVWEYCDRGTLNRLLYHPRDEKQAKIPESLCWHVLDGVSQALLWLHYGHKRTFPYDMHMGHDEDWHPIMIAKISPANIYFTAPDRNQTYGSVKLGCFQSAIVASTTMYIGAPLPIWCKSVYQPPNLRAGDDLWTASGDVYSLGAVIYHMMVGEPPQRLHPSPTEDADIASIPNAYWMKALPQQYSPELRTIVTAMLDLQQDRRPAAYDLSVDVNRGMSVWRETTPEGKAFVASDEDGRSASAQDESEAFSASS